MPQAKAQYQAQDGLRGNPEDQSKIAAKNDMVDDF
jgi:hypothetical protein